jgi:hypothetical protein
VIIMMVFNTLFLIFPRFNILKINLLSKFEYAAGSHLELSFCWLSVGTQFE